MSLTQVWGACLILILGPLLGGCPLTGWSTWLLTGKRLSQLGTGNVSVSAAFYHGGRLAGILAVLLEAAKGIAVVLWARHVFPQEPVWEIIALMALVMGRYWISQGAGTTNVTWGIIIHDPLTAALVFGISAIGFTLVRDRKSGRLLVLVLLPLLTALRHSDDGGRVLAMVCLSGLIAWIYQKIPDDLALSAQDSRLESRQMFRFFRGDRALLSLDQPLKPEKVGHKAATLAQLNAWGYPVPRGYVLLAGDDPAPLLDITTPSPSQPLVVRSSALDEDTDTASAAGLYTSVTQITDQAELAAAIARCFASYQTPAAVQYRRQHHRPDTGLAVLVQEQVGGLYSGVAFSRDPISRVGEAVIIEALPGMASQVVSGQTTPEQYRVLVQEDDISPPSEPDALADWTLPDALTLTVEGQGQVPQRLVQQVAYLARHIEARYHGIPQDIEWTYDGHTLWLLQSRPITTMQPLWTRKIAAEVIPGVIRPLTWSINRPLTCGVWGDLFTLVLGNRAEGLDFEATATLHYSRAYFNASLLGDIFLRMGLPRESLDVLTRGASFSKPPLSTTLRNLPGLLRLLGRELWLEDDFNRDQSTFFQPGLMALAKSTPTEMAPEDLLETIEDILALLKRATYYSILVPLSIAIRQAIFRVADTDLDGSQNPEVAALNELKSLAQDTRLLLSTMELDSISSASSLLAALAEHADGDSILSRLDNLVMKYGYLSQVGTDISVPTWTENPSPVRELFAQMVLAPTPTTATQSKHQKAAVSTSWQVEMVQRRLNLKGQVTAVYTRLLAELRWSFVALGQHWHRLGYLEQPDDIFYLQLDEIRQQVNDSLEPRWAALREAIAARRWQLQQDQKVSSVPYLVYGNAPPQLHRLPPLQSPVAQVFRGIGASPGVVEGTVRVLSDLSSAGALGHDTILVVPYTDAGWAPLLAQAKGLVAEVGGRLSHGAIVAREYGIPAVMNVNQATQRLHDGQCVRLDGEKGSVEVLL